VQRRFSVERMVADHVRFYESAIAAYQTSTSTVDWAGS
jgi:hypothetical protein